MDDLKYTITTKEHFNKYHNYMKGIKKEILLSLVSGLYSNKEELQQKFNKDLYLNNVSMKEIDLRFKEVGSFLAKHNKIKTEINKDNKKSYWFSLAESCSFIKHILIYIVLEIKPFFQEDIKNYNELYLEWRNMDDSKKYGVNGLGCDMWFMKNKHKWIFKTD